MPPGCADGAANETPFGGGVGTCSGANSAPVGPSFVIRAAACLTSARKYQTTQAMSAGQAISAPNLEVVTRLNVAAPQIDIIGSQVRSTLPLQMNIVGDRAGTAERANVDISGAEAIGIDAGEDWSQRQIRNRKICERFREERRSKPVHRESLDAEDAVRHEAARSEGEDHRDCGSERR